MRIGIVIEANTEDPEVGGYFAYLMDEWDYSPINGQRSNLPRGFGKTESEAIACLMYVKAEQNGQEWVNHPNPFIWVEKPIRCEGYRRYGGAFSFGPPQWRQCTNHASVMIHVEQDGNNDSYPSCFECIDEILTHGNQYGIKLNSISELKKE